MFSVFNFIFCFLLFTEDDWKQAHSPAKGQKPAEASTHTHTHSQDEKTLLDMARLAVALRRVRLVAGLDAAH